MGINAPTWASRRIAAKALLATLAALIVSGCGGSAGTGNSARIRAVNTVPNGGSAAIYINSGSANGSQSFEQASPYLYIDGGTSQLSFALSTGTTTTGTALTRTLTNGVAYTVILLGRADVASADPRAPRLILLQDTLPTGASGTAFVRFVNCAPDAGTISVSTGGASAVNLLGYGSASGYLLIPSGSQSVVAANGSGAVSSATLSFSAGRAYTVCLVEPTVSSSATPAPTFSFLQLSDTF